MGIRLTKPWIDLGPDPVATAAVLPGQLGVFQFADRTGEVVLIGCAGGRERFGLRSAIGDALVRHRRLEPRSFRYECTHGYHSRWQELLMIHLHDTGRLPAGNSVPAGGLGSLRPGAESRGESRAWT